MATNFLVYEMVWFDKFKHDDAERKKFYEEMKRPVAGSSHQCSGAPGLLMGLVDTTKAGCLDRQPGSREPEPANHGARSAAGHFQAEGPAEHPGEELAYPQSHNPTDLAYVSHRQERGQGSSLLWEERLWQYAEKMAKKLLLVAKSSIFLNVKPMDDKTDMAQLEACIYSIQCELVWGTSQLVPVGYGILKLVEDDKVDTDLLEEQITKFKEHMQSEVARYNIFPLRAYPWLGTFSN
uniref:Translation elongation factor EF1B beta/delta subunit guanine nucleotide exchange domain-containing protein n=1 Tax=Marmota marmota marmota TaxID=9994 RepID=A0A8C5ZHT3_MARMA